MFHILCRSLNIPMTRISRAMTILRTETALIPRATATVMVMVTVVDKDKAVMGVVSDMEIVNPCPP